MERTPDHRPAPADPVTDLGAKQAQAQRLQQLLRELNLTGADLARYLNVTEKTVSEARQGKGAGIGPRLAERIRQVFGYREAWLRGGQGEPTEAAHLALGRADAVSRWLTEATMRGESRPGQVREVALVLVTRFASQRAELRPAQVRALTTQVGLLLDHLGALLLDPQKVLPD